MAVSLLQSGLRAAQNSDGFEYEETYRVTALAGGSDQIKVDSALSAVGIPALGDAHPVEASSLVTLVQASIVGPNMADVVVNYSDPKNEGDNPKLDTTGVVRFFATTSGDVTTKDKDGALMEVLYTGSVAQVYFGGTGAGVGGAVNGRELLEVEIFRPQFGFELTRRETSISTVRALALTHIGRVNDATYSTMAARTVLCTGIDLDELNVSELRTRYTFEYKPETWDVNHTIRINGRIPMDAGPDITNPTPPPALIPKGQGTFKVYPEANFSSLPVSF